MTGKFNYFKLFKHLNLFKYVISYGQCHDFYLGKGGILGLVNSVSATPFPKMGKIYAQLNALGHGPSIVSIPGETLKIIHRKAASGSRDHQQFEMCLFRLASLHVIEFMQEEILDILQKCHEKEQALILNKKSIVFSNNSQISNNNNSDKTSSSNCSDKKALPKLNAIINPLNQDNIHLNSQNNDESNQDKFVIQVS